MKLGLSTRIVPAAVLTLLVAVGPSASAIAIWPSMPGLWVGAGQSAVQSGRSTVEPFLSVTRQERGRFTGLFAVEGDRQLPDWKAVFMCDGSVQPSPERDTGQDRGSVVNVSGVSVDGTFTLAMHGKTRAMGDGSVRLAALRYIILDARGAFVDAGYLVVVQRFGGLSWEHPGDVPDASGKYFGAYSSDEDFGTGSLVAILTGHRDAAGGLTSALQGPLEFDASGTPEPGGPVPIPYPVLLFTQGTVGLPAVQTPGSEPGAPLLTVGVQPGSSQDEPGIVSVLIGLLRPGATDNGVTLPYIEGRYALYHSAADAFRAIWRGEGGALDEGTFTLRANPAP